MMLYTKRGWFSLWALGALLALAGIAVAAEKPAPSASRGKPGKGVARAAGMRQSRLPSLLLTPLTLRKLFEAEEEESEGMGARMGLFLEPSEPGFPGDFVSLPSGLTEEGEFEDDGQGNGDSPIDPSETRPEPWVGQLGITETVAQIMERERKFPSKGIIFRPEMKYPDRSGLPQDPNSPEAPQWPPNEGNDNGTPRRGRFNPQTVSTSFQAITLGEGLAFPPDTIGSVGPTQIVVCSNGRIKVFDKTGVLGGLNASMNTFFSTVRGNAGITDPRVRYDPISGRWFVIAITVAFPNRVMFGVSSGPNITNASSFTFFFFQQDTVTTAGNTGALLDYPTLGVDANALYIAGNAFTLNAQQQAVYNGTSVFVVRKSSITGPGPIVATAFRNVQSNGGMLTPQGVNNDDPGATQGYFIGISSSAFGRLVMRRISTPATTPTISGNLNITVSTTTIPQNQQAMGSTRLLDALDDRLFAAEIHLNRLTNTRTLWTAHNFEVNSGGAASNSGNRNGSRWYEIQNLTTTPTVRQAGTLFDNAASDPNGFWIPSIVMSGQGHAAIGASFAGPNRRADIAVAGRLRTDVLGLTQAATVALTSTTDYNPTNPPQNPYRWGDYSQMCVDPTDDMTIWAFQEYCNAATSWAVRVIKLLAPPPAMPTSLSPNTVNRGVTTNVVVTGTSASGSEFFDPGPSFNRLQASVSETGVTVNSVTFTDPTHFTMNITVAANATLSTRTITVTNPDGQAITSGALLTVQAGNNAISGTITLEDNTNMAFPLTFEFRPIPSGSALTRTVTPSAGGAYSVTDIPSGNYNLAIKGSKWLRKVIAVNSTSSPVTNANATLKSGDANNDNFVDQNDLAALIAAFDADPSSSNWNGGKADFNNDNVVDLLDLSIIIRNFDLEGDP